MNDYCCNIKFSVSPEIEVERPWVHAAPGVRSELVCNVIADPDAKVCATSLIWLNSGLLCLSIS